MIRIGIVGASGYTGVELARLLCGCADVKLTVATSRQYKGKRLAEVYPNLAGLVDIVCEDLPTEELVARADLFFTAVPHQTAMAIVPDLMQAGKNGTRSIQRRNTLLRRYTVCRNCIGSRLPKLD